MGWSLWSSAPEKGPKLDKDLQTFLDEELSQPNKPSSSSSRTNQASSQQPPQLNPKTQPEQSAQAQAPKPTLTDVPATTSDVPSESAFGDGRYAYLWKGYRPMAEVEAASEDHTSRLRSLSQVHKTRERRIDEAAKESCVMESEALINCYKGGNPSDLITMCMSATRAKSSCIEMQTKFLRALGYMATIGQDEDLQDRLQIHADLMYRRMLEHEREIEEAIKDGRPAPESKPVMSRENVAAVLRTVVSTNEHKKTSSSLSAKPNGTNSIPQPMTFEEVLKLDPKQEAEYNSAIKGKSPEQIALIQREIEGESIFRLAGNRQINSYLDIERKERALRTAVGKPHFGDYILNWWGFNSASKDDK